MMKRYVWRIRRVRAKARRREFKGTTPAEASTNWDPESVTYG
jgi:hypothetical protein